VADAEVRSTGWPYHVYRVQGWRTHGRGAHWSRDVFQDGRTPYYRGQKFQSLKDAGFKSNYYCVETGEDYWISGPKRRGGDALYGGSTPIEIDDDVRDEYWRDIRRQRERIHEPVA
jgi:hypothetical protein